MVAGGHTAQHSEAVPPVRMMGTPTRQAGSGIFAGSPATVETGDDISHEHRARATRGDVTITAITRTGSSLGMIRLSPICNRASLMEGGFRVWRF
jgi:hypothetical protein